FTVRPARHARSCDGLRTDFLQRTSNPESCALITNVERAWWQTASGWLRSSVEAQSPKPAVRCAEFRLESTRLFLNRRTRTCAGSIWTCQQMRLSSLQVARR